MPDGEAGGEGLGLPAGDPGGSGEDDSSRRGEGGLSTEPRYRILYVDDDETNRLVFHSSFRSKFEVDLAESGTEALVKLRKAEYAVLVTDQRMPMMSGNELLGHARQLCPSTQRMIITAYSDTQPILDAVNTGLVSKYIVKPWVKDELEGALLGCIEIWRLHKENLDLSARLFSAEKLSSIGALAAGVFHDLGTPLSVLNAGMDFLNRNAGSGEELKKELPSLLPEMSQAFSHLRELVGSAKGMAEQDVGKGDPAEAVRRALAVCGPKLRAANAKLETQVEEHLPETRLSTPAMVRCLVNFLINSLQAMPEGRPPVIKVSAARERDGILLKVVDNGAGMTPEVLSRARDPFFTTKPPGVGTGLGLFATQRAVSQVDGKLTLTSVAGEGTTASVWLPRG